MATISIFCNLILLKFKFFTRNIGKIKNKIKSKYNEFDPYNSCGLEDI